MRAAVSFQRSACTQDPGLTPVAKCRVGTAHRTIFPEQPGAAVPHVNALYENSFAEDLEAARGPLPHQNDIFCR